MEAAPAAPAAPAAGCGAPVERRLVRREAPEDRGSDVVSDDDVADMKDELAALRMGVGRARRMRCEVGIEPARSAAEATASCDGGIHGASRWILPRMWPGMRSAVASA